MKQRPNCCSKPEIKTFNDRPDVYNATCQNCDAYFLKIDGVIVQYSKNEWSQIINSMKSFEAIKDATCHICGDKPAFLKPILLPNNWHFDSSDHDCFWCECGCGDEPQGGDL